MKNIASLFSPDARVELKRQLNIELSDSHDYTGDELETLYERITDDFPYAFDADGEPLRMGVIFESIIDVFVKNKLIQFN